MMLSSFERAETVAPCETPFLPLALGMKGEQYAFDQFDYYSGCCWSDPLAG